MKKAVILDRDGTINVDFGYLYRPEQLKFIPGVLEGLKRIRQAGFLLIIVTNQSGIARGYYTEEQYQTFEIFMLKEMAKQGVIIDKVYHCPHREEDHCSCRKPLLGMFYQAADEFEIDWEKSYVIGDKERDLAVCEKENVTGILFDSGESEGDRLNRGGNTQECTSFRELGRNRIRMGSWEEIAAYITKAG